jgi:hypothetical protein
MHVSAAAVAVAVAVVVAAAAAAGDGGDDDGGAAAQVRLHNEVSGQWNGIYQRPRHYIQYGGSYGIGVERAVG